MKVGLLLLGAVTIALVITLLTSLRSGSAESSEQPILQRKAPSPEVPGSVVLLTPPPSNGTDRTEASVGPATTVEQTPPNTVEPNRTLADEPVELIISKYEDASKEFVSLRHRATMEVIANGSALAGSSNPLDESLTTPTGGADVAYVSCTTKGMHYLVELNRGTHPELFAIQDYRLELRHELERRKDINKAVDPEPTIPRRAQ